MTQSFVLDEEVARDWLTDLVVVTELSADIVDSDADTATANPLGDLSITMNWEPRDPGQEDTVCDLIRHAQHQPGVLTAPAHTELELSHLDDGDDWAYQFLLTINAPALLTLASPSNQIRNLGQSDTSGVEAAMAILREAVQKANTLLGQLATFLTAAGSR